MRPQASDDDDVRPLIESVASVLHSAWAGLDSCRTIVALGLLLGVLCGAAEAAAVRIEIEGLEDDLKEAALASLDLHKFSEREITPTQVRRFFNRAENQIKTALQPYGYYHAVVESALIEKEPETYLARFRVHRGDPVIVRTSNIRIVGAASNIAAIRLALEQFKPRVGDRLDHSLYERSKNAIDTQLQAYGFFDSELIEHRVEVSKATSSADIRLLWQSNERYSLGSVEFSESQFPADFLQRYVPWQEGDFYSVDQLLTLQQRLVDADYFSSVSVLPDVDRAEDGVVPIEALVIPAKRTVYTAALYISTDTGPGVRLGIDRRWINNRGHKLGGEITYSQRLQQIATTYRIPVPDKQRMYTFSGGYRDEETDTSRSRMARLSATQISEQWNDFTRTLGLHYLNGDFEIADQQRSSSLLYAEALLTRRRADDLLFPRRGLSLLYGLRLAAEQLLSDTSLAQLRAEAKWIRPGGKRGRFILRAAAGAMVVDDFDALPPELRFFAGGDRSLRGFDYQAIGEMNEEGGVIGGKYLTVASLEYEHYFRDNWGVATFVDAGDAYSSVFDVNVAAGLGLRWRSPVGLVRLDVAAPIASDLEHGIRVHLIIGPDL
nr:outer membrane protein assembly factor [Gammaproteobacteria bacterium]